MDEISFLLLGLLDLVLPVTSDLTVFSLFSFVCSAFIFSRENSTIGLYKWRR